MSRNDLRRVRAFVAIEVGASAMYRAAEAVKKLKTAGVEARWTPRDGAHVTLKFLGDIDAKDIVPLCRLLERVAKEFKPFELGFGGLAAFPSAEKPRTLWMGVQEGAEELARLQATIEETLKREMGFSKEPRKFTPHITLGRIEGDSSALVPLLKEMANYPGDVDHVEEIILFSSVQGPKGPTYETLGTAALGIGRKPTDDDLDDEDEEEAEEPLAYDAEALDKWAADDELDDGDLEEDELDDEVGDDESEFEDELDDEDGEDETPTKDRSGKRLLESLDADEEDPAERKVIDDALLEKLLGKRTAPDPEAPGEGKRPRKKRRD